MEMAPRPPGSQGYWQRMNSSANPGRGEPMKIQFCRFGSNPFVYGTVEIYADGTVVYEDAVGYWEGHLEYMVKDIAKAKGRKPDAAFILDLPILLTDRLDAVPLEKEDRDWWLTRWNFWRLTGRPPSSITKRGDAMNLHDEWKLLGAAIDSAYSAYERVAAKISHNAVLASALEAKMERLEHVKRLSSKLER